jgi:hypothetical protein
MSWPLRSEDEDKTEPVQILIAHGHDDLRGKASWGLLGPSGTCASFGTSSARPCHLCGWPVSVTGCPQTWRHRTWLDRIRPHGTLTTLGVWYHAEPKQLALRSTHLLANSRAVRAPRPQAPRPQTPAPAVARVDEGNGLRLRVQDQDLRCVGRTAAGRAGPGACG